MSQVKTNEFEGDVAIGRHVTAGGSATIRGHATVGKDLIVKGWLKARNIKGVCKGLFPSAERLETLYPRPCDGWWAMVGDTIPADIYRAEFGRWVPTGQQGGSPLLEADSLNELERLFEEMMHGNASDSIENFSEVIAFLTGYKDTDSLQALLAELLRRIQGISEKSNAETDPMIHLGGFESWEALVEKLGTLYPTETENHKYNGMLRFHINGLQLHAFQFPREWAAQDCFQVIYGPVRIENGGLAISATYKTLWRRHTKNDGWTAWQEYIPELPLATRLKAGLVKIGANIAVAEDGTISVPKPYGTSPGVVCPSPLYFEELENGKLGLKAATAERAGVVKPGSGLTVAADGTLSVPEVSMGEAGLMSAEDKQKLSTLSNNCGLPFEIYQGGGSILAAGYSGHDGKAVYVPTQKRFAYLAPDGKLYGTWSAYPSSGAGVDVQQAATSDYMPGGMSPSRFMLYRLTRSVAGYATGLYAFDDNGLIPLSGGGGSGEIIIE